MGFGCFIIGIILHFTNGFIPWFSYKVQYFLPINLKTSLILRQYWIEFAAIPINKQLYSLSYVCFTAGAAGIVFSGFYILVKMESKSLSNPFFISEPLAFWFNALFVSLLFHPSSTQIDIWGFRKPFLFLEWIGMNAMLVFVMAAQGIFAAFINGWYYKDPENSLVNSVISWHS